MFVPDIHSVPLLASGAFGDMMLVDDGGVQVGVWSAQPGELVGTTGDYDEVMLMVGGRATVRHDDGEYDLAPGVLWSTPRHWRGDWAVHREVRKMYVIDHRAVEASSPAYLSNAHTAELGAATRRPTVLDGDPHERSLTLWSHNRIETGVWDCTPGTFPFRRDGYDEVFCVLAGHATVAFDSGMSFDMRSGSMLVTTSGSTGTWTVHETVRKAFVIVHDRQPRRAPAD
ncbi:MAG: cupin domain-containing protein [Ilumatobacteraceae bacterium]